MRIRPPRQVIWSTDTLDLSDPFQRRHYIRQVHLHGRAEDVRTLDLDEVAAALDDIHLPPDIHSLWERFLRERKHPTPQPAYFGEVDHRVRSMPTSGFS